MRFSLLIDQFSVRISANARFYGAGAFNTKSPESMAFAPEWVQEVSDLVPAVSAVFVDSYTGFAVISRQDTETSWKEILFGTETASGVLDIIAYSHERGEHAIEITFRKVEKIQITEE